MKLSMQKTATAGAVLALGASAFLAGAPAANASGSGTACPSGRVCFYFNSDFQGARADYAYSDAGMGNELFTDGPAGRNGWGVQVNNNAASVINNSGHTLYLYTEPNCDVRSMVGGGGLFPGTRYNLAAFNAKNDISSIQIAGVGSDCISRDQSWA
ncbi:peptidase inhibitor family I36 protein [Pseudarthrobacter oxydans]|uniref:peptidase inhibitor family I36 protein n=1 Tax=Pseudarthrobacter oxydans TaxID=1671 RepID=UPI00382D19BF